jgi:predicted nucleotidyltransferase
MWARQKPLIKRVFVFGSRVRGDHRPDSDIDIAVELDPNHFQGVDESGGLATWMFETEAWKDELHRLLQLERYHAGQTPTIASGLARSRVLVYEKAT